MNRPVACTGEVLLCVFAVLSSSTARGQQPATSPPVTSQPVTSPPATSPRVTSPPVTSPPVKQEPTGQQQSKPVVVTATRREESPFEVPYSVRSITLDDLQRRSYRTVPQALRDVPGVMIQETAHGHGSPYIRGFTSFRNLFLVDGVRLNNSVFRPGPNQYWNTVDPYSIERLEIVKGPSSVLYGSDAVGGTVNALTKSSYAESSSSEFAFAGATSVRYATAEDSIHGRAELSLHLPMESMGRTAILIGGTAKSFGDLEGGSGVGTQRDTGYDETGIDLKVEHFFDRDTRLVFLHQKVDQNDVPRTHRTVNGINWRGVTRGSDLQRDFDQDRALTYLQFHKEAMGGPVDTLRTNLSWHRQEETRKRTRGSGNQEEQGFDVGTLGLWAQLESDTPVGQLTYGVEYYHDDVDSFFRRFANPAPADTIQGPVADDATYDLIGIYLQDRIEIAKDLDVTLGARFNYAAADADSVRDPVTNQQIAIHENWKSLAGSGRIRYAIDPETVNVFGGVSQGFRAPNLSDLSRFDSARSNEFEVPATSLDAEDYISYEVGVKAQTDDLSLETSFFYTDIDDQILRFPTGTVNAAGESQVTKGNVGDGYVQGIELGAAYRVLPAWTIFGNGTYMEGKVTNFENAASTLQETYLTRLMPLTLQVGLRTESKDGRLWGETVVVHAEDADKLSFSDQRDTSRIPPGGTPGYTVWHVRAGLQLTENASIQALLENITDVDYRVHGSGLNRPGTNLILGFSTTF